MVKTTNVDKTCWYNVESAAPKIAPLDCVLFIRRAFSRLLSPLLDGELDVVLHADVDHIAGGADETAEEAGSASHRHALGERDRLAVGRYPGLRHLKNVNKGAYEIWSI